MGSDLRINIHRAYPVETEANPWRCCSKWSLHLQGQKGSRLLISPAVRIRPHSAPSSPSLGMTLGKVASVEHLSQELTILLVAGGRVPQFSPTLLHLSTSSSEPGIATSVSAFDISSWIPCWLPLPLRCVNVKFSYAEVK